MDGILPRVSARTGEGHLNGYRVQVFNAGGWHY
jgi:hypothetical protein